MANTKKNNVSTTESLNIEQENLKAVNKEQENLINELNKQNEESKMAIELLTKQMQEMQAAFVKMQSSNNNIINKSLDSNKKISIGCRLINGVTLYSPKREVEIRIPNNQAVDFNIQEIELLLKSQFVRDFLAKDVIYFTDENDYEEFKIYNRKHLDDDMLTNLVMNSDENTLNNKLFELTNNKRDDVIIHVIFYKIIELYQNGIITRMTYKNRQVIEKFFKYNMENAIMLLERVNQIKKD